MQIKPRLRLGNKLTNNTSQWDIGFWDDGRFWDSFLSAISGIILRLRG